MTARRTLPTTTFLAAALAAHCGWAESGNPSATADRVTAQVLFEQGRALFVEGNFERACPLLEQSHRLAPAIGVLLHLGACLERSEQIAGAWAAFSEAADRARAEGDRERENLARSRAQQLKAKLAYVTLKVIVTGTEGDASPTVPADLAIECDGQTIPAATVGVEMPIDPKSHHLRIRARGMQEATRDFSPQSGEHATLTFELRPLPDVAAEPSVQQRKTQSDSAVAVSSVEIRSRTLVPTRTDRWAWLPWSAFGVGAAGLLTATGAGLLAAAKMRDARAQCAGHASNDCPPEALRLQEQAETRATVATVTLIAGTASLTFAGAYWLMSRPGRTVVTGSVGPSAGFVAVQSHW